ncbi:MAG TPA: hypothetical protein VEK79_14285 [Thermoanaerobaculia bacterium]|nr:hypothetical protein [Thermoanaerobaculia bacterium]
MSELIPIWVSAFCLVLALVHVPLLVMRPSAAERRLWRRLGVQHLRRRLTRARDGRLDARIGAAAKRNIVWHLVLTLVIALLVLHPAVRSMRYRGVVDAFAVAGCVAYVAGSVVQRQKIVVTSLRRR